MPQFRLQLRRAMRVRRQALSSKEQSARSVQLAKLAAKLILFGAGRRLAFYLANDGELDPAPLLKIAAARGKICYLPALESQSRRLWFAPYKPGQLLQRGVRWGLPEPATQAHSKRLRAKDLDILFIPLVAFDNNGNRLGRGGGYYDYSLAFLKRRRFWLRPRIIGLAHSFQQVPLLEPQSWDVPLSAVVTEQQLLSCNNHRSLQRLAGLCSPI